LSLGFALLPQIPFVFSFLFLFNLFSPFFLPASTDSMNFIFLSSFVVATVDSKVEVVVVVVCYFILLHHHPYFGPLWALCSSEILPSGFPFHLNMTSW
jgi:hypothetical protein